MIPSLQQLWGEIKVKAKKEGALYEKYEGELKEMVTRLDEFICECTVQVCEAEEMDKDASDDAPMKKMKMFLEGFTTNAEHHLGGAKAAKARFQGIVS